jgi:GntR family transcriptional regulator
VAEGVDPSSDRPVYKQIADLLRGMIERGELGPGERLPSETELTKRYGVAQGTVRQAVGLLRSEGIVIAEHGRGVFVRPRPRLRRLAYDRFARRHREAGKSAYDAEAEAEKVTAFVDQINVHADKASAEVAGRLGLRKGAKVLVRSRRYLSDDQPTEIATSYIPWELARGTKMVEENPGPGGIYARIEEGGHKLGRFTEEVTARMPTPDEMKALRLAPGSPVIGLVRTAYDVDGMAVEICDTVMSADLYALFYELPAT